MKKAPFTSVENTFGDTLHMDGKSPRKLTVHERDVINGLKRLTEVIFKPHFRPEQTTNVSAPASPSEQGEPSTTPHEPSNLFSLVASSVMANENQTPDLDSILDVAMNEAEQFCAMVVQQLNTNQDNDTDDDWHSGQLHAYSSVSQRMFDTTADGRSNAAAACDNVRRQLNDF